MRKLHSILFILTVVCTSAQIPEGFKKEFKKALEINYSQQNLTKIYSDYYGYLSVPYEDDAFLQDANGNDLKHFALSDFKKDKLYSDNMLNLLNAENPNRRALAYMTIGAAGDLSYEDILLKRMNTEKSELCKTWVVQTLLNIRTTHTTPLFDLIASDENFRNSSVTLPFVRMNKDSLRETAYSRIHGSDPWVQRLSAQVLWNTGLNPKTENLLKTAVREWAPEVKITAIYGLQALKAGHLLETLKPCLNDSITRNIAFETLLKSPTETDRNYSYEWLNQQKVVSNEIRNYLFHTANRKDLAFWLKFLPGAPLSSRYSFTVSTQALLHADTLLPELQQTLKMLSNTGHLAELLKALEGRTDEPSTQLLLSFLLHSDAKVRTSAARALNGNHAPKLVEQLPFLISRPELRTPALSYLAIENKLDTFQLIYEELLKVDPGKVVFSLVKEIKNSAIDYLSAFPKEQERLLFHKILQDMREEQYIIQKAVLGLGRLKDESSVELLLARLKEEGSGEADRDHTIEVYLTALAMIKGDKAKSAIAKFKNSKDPKLKELALALLKEW